MEKTIIAPTILTTDTSIWKPGINTHLRRWNEKRETDRVIRYFNAIGFSTERVSECLVNAEHPSGVHIIFFYSESSSKVRSYLIVSKNGIRQQDITAIRDIANSL